jgi:hypothetical protein
MELFTATCLAQAKELTTYGAPQETPTLNEKVHNRDNIS